MAIRYDARPTQQAIKGAERRKDCDIEKLLIELSSPHSSYRYIVRFLCNPYLQYRFRLFRKFKIVYKQEATYLFATYPKTKERVKIKAYLIPMTKNSKSLRCMYKVYIDKVYKCTCKNQQKVIQYLMSYYNIDNYEG